MPVDSEKIMDRFTNNEFNNKIPTSLVYVRY